MAFNVTFYSFSKKKNSTARPTGSGTTFACRIKAPSGIIHPIIEISSLSDTFPTFNYAYIPAFDERYYFVREWTQEPGNIWAVQLDADPLASWKTAIGSQSFYVLRSSAQRDGLIRDTMYPMRATYTYNITAGTGGNWWNVTTSGIASLLQGYYVVGLLSYNAGFGIQLVGGLNYIAMIPAQFFAFLGKIFNVNDSSSYMSKASTSVAAVFQGQQTLTQDQLNNLAYIAENPFTDYIKSITWVPNCPRINPDAPRNSLYLGPNELTGFEYYPVAVKESYRYNARFPVQQHPQAAARGKFLNCEPFTELYLNLPKMGSVQIPADLFANKNYIWITLDIDPITGEGLYILYSSNDDGLVNAAEVQRWYAQVGVQIEIAQTKDVGERGQALANLAGIGLNFLQGNPGAITQLPAAIGEISRSRNVSGKTIGSAGGWLGMANGQPYLITIHHEVAADDNSHNGRPLCAVHTPASLGGYMMIQDADISIYGTEEEHDIIKETMESGFYYE